MASTAPPRTYIRRSNDEERKAARAESSRKFREKQRMQLALINTLPTPSPAMTPPPPTGTVELFEYRLEQLTRCYDAQIQELLSQFVVLRNEVKSLRVKA